jgi:hypothetical protein
MPQNASETPGIDRRLPEGTVDQMQQCPCTPDPYPHLRHHCTEPQHLYHPLAQCRLFPGCIVASRTPHQHANTRKYQKRGPCSWASAWVWAAWAWTWAWTWSWTWALEWTWACTWTWNWVSQEVCDRLSHDAAWRGLCNRACRLRGTAGLFWPFLPESPALCSPLRFLPSESGGIERAL